MPGDGRGTVIAVSDVWRQKKVCDCYGVGEMHVKSKRKCLPIVQKKNGVCAMDSVTDAMITLTMISWK